MKTGGQALLDHQAKPDLHHKLLTVYDHQYNAAYKLDVNEFRGNRSVQLILQYLEKNY